MLYSKHQNLADHIVDYLAYRPGSQLAVMQKEVGLVAGYFSFQAWYKCLRKLLQDGVVVKAKKGYSLNANWVSQLSRFSYFAKTNYLTNRPSHSVLLPEKDGEQVTYSFPDLLTMDTFWGHVATSLIVRNQGKAFYFYNPHTWFFVAHEFESRAYFESFRTYQVRNYTVVGSRSDLDRWSGRLHPNKLSEYYCSPKPLFDSRLYLTAIGNYYIVVKLSALMASNIDSLFSKVSFDYNQGEPPAGLEALFTKKSVCSMKVYLDTKKAGMFSRKIARYF